MPIQGFTRAVDPVRPRLIISIKALEKSGKTHFAFTAPGPIAYLPFDIGDEGVRQKFQDDKEICVPDGGPYVIKKGDLDAAKSEYSRFEKDYELALAGARSTIIDTASEAWECIRLAKLGKLTQVMPVKYVEVNSVYRDLVREAYESNSNLILLHKMKPEWVDNNKTGKFERAGFADTGFLVQINAWAYREDRDKMTGNYPGGVDDNGFRLHIEDCRQNADLAGTTLGEPGGYPCDFPTLAMLVFPASDPMEWM